MFFIHGRFVVMSGQLRIDASLCGNRHPAALCILADINCGVDVTLGLLSMRPQPRAPESADAAMSTSMLFGARIKPVKPPRKGVQRDSVCLHRQVESQTVV